MENMKNMESVKNITVDLLKAVLSNKKLEKAILIVDETKERIKLSEINYKNEKVLREKGYLLHQVVKNVEENNGKVEIHI